MSNQAQIDALLIERAGYLRYGKTDRADQVTAELKRLGYTEPSRQVDAAPAAETRGRRTAKG